MTVNQSISALMTMLPLHARLSRLEALTQRLSDGATYHVAALAEELGVSQRTLARDLALLREQGWALEGASGRGGGIRVAHRWSSGRVTLRGDDALELLVALALSEALELSPGNRHDALRRQFAHCFAPADREDIARLRQRVRVASPVSTDIQKSHRTSVPQVRGCVYDGFIKQTNLSLRYADAQGQSSERIVEPQCLLLAWPFWYVLVWDVQREAIRTFRLDRIMDARPLEQRFALRAPSIFWATCDEIGVVL